MNLLTKSNIAKGLIGVLILGVLSTAFVFAGAGNKITHARCTVGAFVTHVSSSSAVASDNDSDAQVGSQSATSDNPASTAYGENLFSDYGMEIGQGAMPQGWDHNVYGTNTAAFSIVAGPTSTAAGRVDVTNYQNGDAHWYHLPVSVTPGQYYEYSDTYRSNVHTRAVLEMIDASGKQTFVNLHNTPATADWKPYTAKFIIPENISSIVVYHDLASNGTLDVDNSSLRTATLKGYDKPLVSVTFDDGWESIYKNALPLLKQYNIPSTQYIISGYLGTPAYMTAEQVYKLRDAGNEIASHTIDHPDLTRLDAKKIDTELKTSQTDLNQCYGDVQSFANPYGAYNDQTTTATKKYYKNARSTDTGYNSADSYMPYALRVQNVDASTTPEQINAWLKTAQDNKVWLILVYHQINEQSAYSRTTAQLTSDLQAIKASNIDVVTMKQGSEAVQKQASR